jgi:hypothetical protein
MKIRGNFDEATKMDSFNNIIKNPVYLIISDKIFENLTRRDIVGRREGTVGEREGRKSTNPLRSLTRGPQAVHPCVPRSTPTYQ